MLKFTNSFGRQFSLASIAILSIVPVAARAATPIQIDYSGDDVVGQRIAYALRESVSKSTLYSLSYTRDKAIFVIHLVTVKNEENVSSSYSAVLTISPGKSGGFGYFVDTIAGNCGSSKVNECASGILSSFDSDISSILSAIAQSAQGDGK